MNRWPQGAWAAGAAIVISTGVGGCGAAAPHHVGSSAAAHYTGPGLSALQAQILTDVQTHFKITNATKVSCVLPSAWRAGQTFKCFVYDSAGTGVGSIAGTVLKTSSGTYHWHENWAATAAAATPTPTSSDVTFTVTGSAPDGIDITYGSNTISDQGGTVLPWTATLPLTSPAPEYYDIYAQLQGSGSVSCSIAVKGKVIQTASASGGYNIADCEISQGLLGGWSGD